MHPLPSILSASSLRVIFAPGAIERLGRVAVDEGATRVLVVTDPGIVRAGHVQRAVDSLRGAGIETTVFDGVCENPTTREVDFGVRVARELGVDFFVGLGGGSSMDCAKGINFVSTNGGTMYDYWGVGKAARPMLPFIAVPTTAGTGSEAQSFALITDPDTHQKMACGDKKALARAAILDPDLLATVPRGVAAATGIDAVAHAIETAGCRTRTAVSRELSRAAWRLLDGAFERFVVAAVPNGVTTAGRGPQTERRGTEDAPGPLSYGRGSDIAAARADMLLGAHLAGAAIEASMLGAAHASANPLTARFGVVHGVAVGLMLPHVICFNAAGGVNPYDEISADAESLARRVEALLDAAGLPRRLMDLGIPPEALDSLAEEAARQWTAGYNPRAVNAHEMLAVYRRAFG
jgi:alcohol dehydrogenase